MQLQLTAIFDIGKTNKKILLFDQEFNLIYQDSTSVPEIVDEDGFPCEDIEKLLDWISNQLNKVCARPEWQIKFLNFSTYGASFIHINQNGERVTPLYNYLKPIEESLVSEFLKLYGPVKDLTLATASPFLGYLNSGLQIFGLKYSKPETFSHIHLSMHLPQYLSYFFTGKFTTDFTSLGCHTMLWDYSQNNYHSWVEKENLANIFPPISNSKNSYPVNYNGNLMKVGIGVHDSSSSLYAYTRLITQPFLLLSTGTWNICLNPDAKEPLTFSLLQKDCLNYMSPDGNPVRASRLFMGKEYEYQTALIEEHFRVNRDQVNQLKFNPVTFRKTYSGSFHFQYLDPEVFDLENAPKTIFAEGYSFDEIYHFLIRGLIEIQVASIKLALGKSQINTLYVDGGFAANEIFLKALSTKLPEMDIFSIQLPQGSSIGSAMLINPDLPVNKLIENYVEIYSIKPEITDEYK